MVPRNSSPIFSQTHTTPGEGKKKNCSRNKGNVYHRGTLITTPLGRYAFQTLQQQIIQAYLVHFLSLLNFRRLKNKKPHERRTRSKQKRTGVCTYGVAVTSEAHGEFHDVGKFPSALESHHRERLLKNLRWVGSSTSFRVAEAEKVATTRVF